MPIIQINDTNTFYETQGSGPPLVLIHGALIDSRMWDPQVEPFSACFQVVRYDLRGHGKTGPSSQRRYSASLLADDLYLLIRELRLEKPVICGLSLGGMVAQSFASKYPGQASALILADTAASTTLTASDKIQTALFGWSLAPSARWLGARRYTDYAVAMAKWTRGTRWFGQNDQVSGYVIECMRQFDTNEMAKVYKMIIDFRTVDLTQVNCPVLILNGEHESKSVFVHAKYLKTQIPQAKLEIIPDAGHTSNMENPVEFTRVVQKFLDSLEDCEKKVLERV